MSTRWFLSGALALSLAVFTVPRSFADDKKGEDNDAFKQKILEMIEKVSADADATEMDRTPWANLTPADTQAALEIEAKLDTQKLSLNFDGNTFDESVDFLRDITNLNIIISRRARDLLDANQAKIKFKVKDIRLRNALELLLIQTDNTLRYGVRNSVLEIGTIDDWKGKNVVLELIPVEDILYQGPDFPAPDLGLSTFGIGKMKK